MSGADELLTVAVAAAELLDDLDGQRQREGDAFGEGYRLGFGTGQEVGYRQAEWDMHRAWTPVAGSVRQLGWSLPHDELEARRYPGYTRERLAELRARARRRFGLPASREAA
ncbi:hypothetical protein [Actinomadura sp. BRA 177]|uniref:hypothetical protein n=1 Tax=Actinomadura sp. BRA 177 TaxID=2745202 RepID=UPI001595F3B3|nr:hypothetical protein [Actinomadura sp. BRA 177]NVI88233.1 hypothetical protein [Actinomadura sp. BRA 177]